MLATKGYGVITTATLLAGADRQPRPNPHRGLLRRPVRRRPDPRRPPGRPTATDSTAAATDRPTGSRTPTPRPPGDPRTKAYAARLTATGKNCKEILRRPRTRHRPPSTAPAGPPPTRTPHRRPAPRAPRTRTHPPPKPPTTRTPTRPGSANSNAAHAPTPPSPQHTANGSTPNNHRPTPLDTNRSITTPPRTAPGTPHVPPRARPSQSPRRSGPAGRRSQRERLNDSPSVTRRCARSASQPAGRRAGTAPRRVRPGPAP